MHHSIPTEHARHDLELIAGHAAGDLTETERIRADAILANCTSCADLRRDLQAIAVAVRSLPAPASAHRDFRLTSAQAASLRRSGWITSLARSFAAPESRLRPMAMAFTSLGLAGLLVANILPTLLGGSTASAPQAGVGGARSVASAGTAATGAPRVPVLVGPPATDRLSAEFGPQAKSTFMADSAGSNGNEATTAPEVALNGTSGTSQPNADLYRVREPVLIVDQGNPLLIGSLVLLAVGLALFGLRFVARRGR